MNNLDIINSIGKKCSSSMAIIYSEDNSPKWLKDIIKSRKMNIVGVNNKSMLDHIMVTFGETNISIVVIDIGPISGEAALKLINEKVKEIRIISSSCGVLIICKNDNQINKNMLPEYTWLITKEMNSDYFSKIIDDILLVKEDKYEGSRKWTISSSMNLKSIRKSKPAFKSTCPNFNIKHPSILVPISIASKELNTPVFFEISPQEALVYYDPSGDNCIERVKKVLKQLREDVDFVKEALGAQIYLHLDHCDDDDLIIYAINIGFDSVMADGSKQNLASNIQFVKNAVNYAKKFNVLVEGEVSAIDTFGRQKYYKTRLEDLKEFSRLTGADYIGVNIGQVHGSDYGFDRSRNSYRKILGIKDNHGSFDVKSLYLACYEIEKEMANSLLEEMPGNIVQFIKRKISSKGNFNSIDDILKDFGEMSLYNEYLLSKVISEFYIKSSMVSNEIIDKYEEVLGISCKAHAKDDSKRLLDIELLSDLNKNVVSKSSKLVLHGGSSICDEDLSIIKDFNIARINFGSEVFNLYLKALLDKSGYIDKETNYSNTLFINNYLYKYASDWRDWVVNPPSFLNAFKDQIINRYFKPLNNENNL
ncbi:class II fructose-bisphosphate aldolase [Clostridium beijerinckii]|uniref:Fructose/tagatose bisphosphate aldolase n=1 Tax=Clostridium beijerinckii TaxID=1520 RepID=A0AAX0BA01_CLOBE|nr:class II fructose-bisphosphate aldolase [Clostridium beijerinckii]NRT91313.1 fructose/tagatose bisphosphate aldolase [Clostridium beijerinckii]NYC70838.1 fructose/tagatose bisphosphate aldolase [Clostridium beijerinckii]